VGSGQRSVSELKIIKNYLRTTVAQERPYEKAAASNINYIDLIAVSAARK
jgi:hypothetical protein